MLRCVGEAIHDASAAQAAHGGVAQRHGLVLRRGARAGAAGRRQPGPGLAVRPVCFRRVFGVLAAKALGGASTLTTLQRDWRATHHSATDSHHLHLKCD